MEGYVTETNKAGIATFLRLQAKKYSNVEQSVNCKTPTKNIKNI